MREIKKRRLRSAQAAGQLPSGVDLDLAVDLIWGPVQHSWLYGTGPLDAAFTDTVVEAALHGLSGRS